MNLKTHLPFTDMKLHQNYTAHLELKQPGMTVRARQFPLSTEDSAEIDKQILQMEEMGLIEKSEDTTFNSPIFLIKKKHTGKTRFVVDLRKVNDVLKPLTVMLPRIDDVLQDIASQKPTIYSSLDLFKGFWAIPLDKSSRKYTNFYSPKTGIPYRYCTLPMGLNSSPGHYQRMTTKIFHNKEYWKFLHLYVDDLLLTSTTFEEHLRHLKQTLQTLRLNNLMLNSTKAYIGHSSITYLGHTLTADGITLSDENVKAIKNIAIPKNKRSLERLLGLLNYFRKYIKNYSLRTTAMRELLKKETVFHWTPECTAELEDLKTALISEPILGQLTKTVIFISQ